MAKDLVNYPADMKKPDYPKSAKQPTVPQNDTPKDIATGTGPQASSELPLGGQNQGAITEHHQQGIDGVGDPHRDQNPVETPPSLSRRNEYPSSDLTQAAVLEKNDPTHDGKSFKNRSWEGKGFENRRMLY